MYKITNPVLKYFIFLKVKRNRRRKKAIAMVDSLESIKGWLRYSESEEYVRYFEEGGNSIYGIIHKVYPDRRSYLTHQFFIQGLVKIWYIDEASAYTNGK